MSPQEAHRTDRAEPQLVQTRIGKVELASFGGGPAVLCLHGAMGGYDQGLILASALGPSGFRYVAISRPGYLRTPRALGWAPEQQADVCAAVLDALELDRCAVMAVSGGGPAAIHFALRHRRRCWGLVLVSTVAQKNDIRPPLRLRLMSLLVHLPGVASSMKRKAVKHPYEMSKRSITDPALFERIRRDPEAWRLLQEMMVSTMDHMPQRVAATFNDAEVAATHEYPLEQVAVPTLIVHGTRDPLVCFERNARVFAARIPGAELVSLEGGEHSAIFSHRGEARARASTFLHAAAPRATAPAS